MRARRVGGRSVRLILLSYLGAEAGSGVQVSCGAHFLYLLSSSSRFCPGFVLVLVLVCIVSLRSSHTDCLQCGHVRSSFLLPTYTSNLFHLHQHHFCIHKTYHLVSVLAINIQQPTPYALYITARNSLKSNTCMLLYALGTNSIQCLA